MFIHYKKFTICFGCLAACGGPCPAGRRPGPGMVSTKGGGTVCALVFGRTSFSQKTRKGQGAKNKRLPTGAAPPSGQIHGTKRQGGLLSRQGFSPRRATRRAGIRAVQVPFPLPHNTNAPLPRRTAQKAQGSVSSQRVFSPHREHPGGRAAVPGAYLLRRPGKLPAVPSSPYHAKRAGRPAPSCSRYRSLRAFTPPVSSAFSGADGSPAVPPGPAPWPG